MKGNEIAGKQALGPKLLVKPLHTTSPSRCHLVAHPVGKNAAWSVRAQAL